jgi:hypothetical protein
MRSHTIKPGGGYLTTQNSVVPENENIEGIANEVALEYA